MQRYLLRASLCTFSICLGEVMDDIQTNALRALEQVDFEWAVHIKSVWRDIDYDIPEIHGNERKAILSRIEGLNQSVDSRSPLGIVIRGNAGAGKTHLLSALRRHAHSRGQVFVLVDMTDVRDFWETVNQGFLTSLEQITPDKKTQLESALAGLVLYSELPLSLEHLTDTSSPSWMLRLKEVLGSLSKKDRAATRIYMDIIRAAVLLGSDDFEVSGLAYNWLLGIPVEEQDFRPLGFSRPCCSAMESVEGLSWLVGLSNSTILALDQLDSIVMQHCLISSVEHGDSDEQKLSQGIIEGIAGGLSALRDKTSRTLAIVTCIEKTWDRLSSFALSSFRDRYESAPIFLANVYDAHSISEMVASRLSPAYLKHNVNPPYRTWPYTPDFFTLAEGMLPRQLLKQCDLHRRNCLEKGEVSELTFIQSAQPRSHKLEHMDQAYQDLISKSTALDLNDDRQEDGPIAQLIQSAVVGLIAELDNDEVFQYEVDTEFTGGWRTRPLHVRIRQLNHVEDHNERHLSMRVLLRTNARAFNNRIKLAMGASGIDRGLRHRQLHIIRNGNLPAGRTCQILIQQFQAAGGEFLNISGEDLRRMDALRQLRQLYPADFQSWQLQSRPFSNLAFLRSAISWLERPEGSSRITQDSPKWPLGSEPYDQFPAIIGSSQTPPLPPPPRWLPDVSTNDIQPAVSLGRIPFGIRLIGQQEGLEIALPIEELSKHTVVLAGSGSGKTVLIRRLVEEAALQGVPSIVIDCANDLARLGDSWERPPEGWRIGDEQKAHDYQQSCEVLLWTPGLESGNPLQLSPLPNFADIEGLEELDQATDMARDALQDIVAQGASQSSLLKRGILKAALNYMATTLPQGTLDDFIALLRELPPEACDGIPSATRKAQEMAGVLWAEVQNNPLLRQLGCTLSPGMLLGVDVISAKTRISVINLAGLQGLSAQRQFLNQLFMTLFTWIKKNPPPANVPLRGLLVLDEAKDFVPARESSACKSSFIRLVAQARKYGLGIVVASQAPKSIDHNVIANCSTQLFGKANSPSAIEVVSEHIARNGGNPSEVTRLKPGQFYICAEGIRPPARIRTPNCLSFHPPSPLNEEEVIARAAKSRLAYV